MTLHEGKGGDSDDDFDDADDDHGDCKCGATPGLGQTCLNMFKPRKAMKIPRNEYVQGNRNNQGVSMNISYFDGHQGIS